MRDRKTLIGPSFGPSPGNDPFCHDGHQVEERGAPPPSSDQSPSSTLRSRSQRPVTRRRPPVPLPLSLSGRPPLPVPVPVGAPDAYCRPRDAPSFSLSDSRCHYGCFPADGDPPADASPPPLPAAAGGAATRGSSGTPHGSHPPPFDFHPHCRRGRRCRRCRRRRRAGGGPPLPHLRPLVGPARL